jgi:hypothetical protein
VSSYDDSRGLDALEHAGQPFSYESREGRPYGYSIDLCEAIVEDIAREIGVASLRTEYRRVRSAGSTTSGSCDTCHQACASARR